MNKFFFFILLLILFIIIKLKFVVEKLGSMSPSKYIIIIDMEYLAKDNNMAEYFFKFMDKNYTTTKIFLGGSKIDAILINTNNANLYFKSRLEALYPNHIKYHFLDFNHSKFFELIKGRTILYLSNKDEFEKKNFENRLLNAEEQIKLYS